MSNARHYCRGNPSKLPYTFALFDPPKIGTQMLNVYSLFTYMYHKFRPNVGKYAYHTLSIWGNLMTSAKSFLVVRRVRVCWPSIFVTPPYPHYGTMTGQPGDFLGEGGIGGKENRRPPP